MRPKISMALAIDVAVCHLCHQVVSETDCWRSDRASRSWVHVLCLAAAIIIDDSPSLLAHEIADRVNDQSEALYAELCENPAHLDHDPCDPSEPIPGQAHVGCYTASAQEWTFDHFHALIAGEPCEHHHATWADADLCAEVGE